MSDLVSPELALVDPALRLSAIAALPPLEAFDFVRFRTPPEARLLDGVVEEVPLARPAERRLSLPLAAALYTAAAIVRVAAFDLLFALSLVLLIVTVSVLK